MQSLAYLIRARSSILLLAGLSTILLGIGTAIWINHALSEFTNITANLVRIGLAIIVLLLARSAFGRRPLTLVLLLIKLRSSVRSLRDKSISLNLDALAFVNLDKLGIPTITAQSSLDALRALGYMCARDRLFQMDLLRREAAGRLSEIFGEVTLKLDVNKRVIGFNRVAKDILANLPEDQKQALRAYADGINAYISQMKSRSFEFFLLRYGPEAWRAEDSILVVLNMFQLLCGDDSVNRMLSIMRASLPPAVVSFLTPELDSYSTFLLGGNASNDPVCPIPLEELASLLNHHKAAHNKKIVRLDKTVAASNCWAVDKSKTADGRAILANDVHMELKVPNYWYQARLFYDNVELSGVLIPGIPVILAGSTNHVAWGLTNLCGDCLDLVPLRINPEDASEYEIESGWRRFNIENEDIRIRGGSTISKVVRTTIWGPVCETELLGCPVALRWTALDSTAVDIGLMHMQHATTVDEAAQIVNNFAGPPLSVVIADASGRIAYTVCGRIPIRRESEGSSPEVRTGDEYGWAGYIPPDQLPRVMDPPSGFFVTANNRTVGPDYAFLLGRNYANGYRASRIVERLEAMSSIKETDMSNLQLDTVSHFYEYYRRLALEVVTEEAADTNAELSESRRIIEEWNGSAELNSKGLLVLSYFREALAENVLGPFLRQCVEVDPQFVYCWRNIESPLRSLLSERIPSLHPEPLQHRDWNSFILGILLACLNRIKNDFKIKSMRTLNWGKINSSRIIHPLSFIVPEFGRILNMQSTQMRGCLHCICVSSPSYGASFRMSVSPGREADGIFNMPCGQSEHPLSDNYADQHRKWIRQRSV